MKFRPCIDIHNGSVKQIVGSSLKDDGSAADNFISELDADFYAKLYRAHGLNDGHIIILNPKGSEYYNADLEQAKKALDAYPGGLQIGGGVNLNNACDFLNMGASKVIVTSFVFHDGEIDFDRLGRLTELVGRKRLVLDLSCKRQGEEYFIVTDRWQRLTNVKLCVSTMQRLSDYCDEFLVHAADAEGKAKGIEIPAAEILASSPINCTYAGGISSLEDIRLLEKIGDGRIDFTVGSALDIFGGSISLNDIIDKFGS